MIYNKNNLLIHQITSDKSRPELGGVLFKKDRTIATDSYKLIEVKNPNEMLKIANEFPSLPDKSKVLTTFSKKGYIIPAKSVKKILSNLTDVNDNLPILNKCVFVNSPDVNWSKIASTNLEKTDMVLTKNIDAEYPNINAILPDKNEKGYKESIVNIKYLKELIDVLYKMDLKENNKITILTSEANDRPIVIKANTTENQDITALLMPIRK